MATWSNDVSRDQYKLKVTLGSSILIQKSGSLCKVSYLYEDRGNPFIQTENKLTRKTRWMTEKKFLIRIENLISILPFNQLLSHTQISENAETKL
jgi:hypothetical protein